MKNIMKILALLILFNSPVYAETNEQMSDSKQWLETLDLQQYKNKVVYLDFWASWCGPCRQSFPWLNQMQLKYKDKGLVVIGINLDRDKKSALQFLKALPAEFLLYFDPKGDMGKKYKLVGMPSSYIFDGNGQLLTAHVGFKKSNVDEYEASIVRLITQLKIKE